MTIDVSERTDIERRGRLFRDLHAGPTLLVLPNPWDAGSARLLANLGYRALATTSAGFAFALGRIDGDGGVTAEETFENARQIVTATDLPVSADLENGFGASPDDVAATIRRAGEIGLAGGSIEDATLGDPDHAGPLYDRSIAIERIHAAVETAKSLGYTFTLTARTEGFIRGRPDLDETLARLSAFEEAGADVLYAPGIPDEATLRRVCASVARPFNYVAGVGPTRFTLAELADIGVRRVSLGSSFTRVALRGLVDAACEVSEEGTFGFLDGLPKTADFNEMIQGRPVALAVHRNETHSPSKSPCASIRLVVGEGVEGDAHRGVGAEARFGDLFHSTLRLGPSGDHYVAERT